jgi:hypothetical protein
MNQERSPEQPGFFSTHKIQIDPDWDEYELDFGFEIYWSGMKQIFAQ